jgi:FkbM family methyltransferase
MKGTILRLRALHGLAHPLSSKINLLGLYILLSVKRWMGLKPSFHTTHQITCMFNSTAFSIFIKDQIDFDILYETFILQEYFIPDLKNVRVIFDIGSNIGIPTVFFLIMYADATVFAFEPIPANALRFLENTKQFQHRIKFFQKAVYPTDHSTIQIYRNEDKHWSGSIMARPANTVPLEVQTISLDAVIKQYQIPKIDLLKFDVEGAEYQIFKNFKSLDSVENAVGEFHPDLVPEKEAVDPDQLFRGFTSNIRLTNQSKRFIATFQRP